MNGPVNDMQENYECFNVGSPDDDIYNEIGQGEDIYEILPDEK